MVTAAMPITVGTNTPATLSAVLAMGAFVAAASLTMRMICESVVSSPTPVARQRRKPDWLIVPALTLSFFRLVHGGGFPRECGLVHGARAGEHDAVHRDAVTGADEENVAENDLLRRDDDLLAVPLQTRRFRRELHERAERVGRFALGMRLERLADGDER